MGSKLLWLARHSCGALPQLLRGLNNWALNYYVINEQKFQALVSKMVLTFKMQQVSCLDCFNHSACKECWDFHEIKIWNESWLLSQQLHDNDCDSVNDEAKYAIKATTNSVRLFFYKPTRSWCCLRQTTIFLRGLLVYTTTWVDSMNNAR